jgi:hypothetical protein
MAAPLPILTRGFGETQRRDAWWLQPLVTFVILGGFVVYATWAAFQNNYYTYGPYLSPFYSPIIFTDKPELAHLAWFGMKPGWWPGLLPFSPALLILPFPGLFRFTCYYYRGAYYKAFWADPINCAVGEPRKSYLGERYFPLILQNVHRYFLYVAVIFLFILAHDVWDALWFTDNGVRHFGIGVGTLVLALNTVLLSCYTLGCHSFRHIVGGFLDQLSKHPVRKKAYDCSSCLNRWHMKWAWMSLFGVAFADVYVRMCSMGIWHDWRII